MQDVPNLGFVDRSRMMFGRFLDQNVGILRAGAVGLIEREVIGNRQADVVTDPYQFAVGDGFADLILDLIDDVLVYVRSWYRSGSVYAGASCRRRFPERNPHLPPDQKHRRDNHQTHAN